MKHKTVSWVAILIGLLLIIAPSNLFLAVCDSCGYVQGLRSDYLIPKLFIADLVLIAVIVVSKNSLISFFKKYSKQLASKYSLLTILAVFLIRQLATSYPSAAVETLLHIGLLGLLAIILITKKNISQKFWFGSLLIGLALQTTISLYQFTQQKPLLPYRYLGETNISRSIGIPSENVGTTIGEKKLPHGTTPHPNVLAGFIAIYSILLIRFLLKTKQTIPQKILVATVVPVSWSVLFLTRSFSGSALLVSGGLVLLLESWIRKQKQLHLLAVILATIFVAGIATTFIQSEHTSITRRNYLLETSSAYLVPTDMQDTKRLFLGTGLSNFTAVAEQFSTNKEIIRFNQPVHNALWLFLVENGLLGLALAVIMIKQIRNKRLLQSINKTALFLLPVLAWDHYLLSLQSGRLLMLLAVFIIQETD